MDARSVVVLFRTIGYLSLQLPPVWRNAACAAAIDAALTTLAGVQQVIYSQPEGRLTIRFDAQATSHAAIAIRLKAVLAELPVPAAPQQENPASDAATAIQDALPAEPDLAARLSGLREQFIATVPERFRPLAESATTEKAITNFTNDIVAFYLIRTHWDLITRLWLKNPVKYGNAWLTVFYLVFLLVRYRKT